MDCSTTHTPMTSARAEQAQNRHVKRDNEAKDTPDGGPGPISTKSRRLSLRQALSVNRERLVWGRRTDSWDSEGAHGLTSIVQAVLDRCRTSPDTVGIDLVCGAG